jgi:hypothetical protein
VKWVVPDEADAAGAKTAIAANAIADTARPATRADILLIPIPLLVGPSFVESRS